MNKNTLESDLIKYYRTIILFVAFLITIISFGTGAVSASSATNVHVTPTTVTATGYNSASGGWYRCTGTFLNYNPVTGNYGVLVWNPKGTAEGEWTATDDDMDFSINGRCKGTGWQHNVWLKKAGMPKKSTVVPTSSTSTTPTTTTDTIGNIKNQLNEPWSVI